MSPVVIAVAITGSVPRKADNPAVPTTPAEQVESTHAAFEAGASLVHIHVRNPDESASSDPALFAQVQEGVRRHCPGMIVQFSTGGRGRDPSARGNALDLRPDMASLSTGSVNFPTIIYENGASLVTDLATRMQAHGVRPEIELFDLSHIHGARRLVDAGLMDPRTHVQVVMGVKNALPAEEHLLDLMLGEIRRALPQATWCAAGIGVNQARVMEWALARAADGVRTGLEDNIRVGRDRLAASNAELVAMAAPRRPPRPPPGHARRSACRPGFARVLTGKGRVIAHLGFPTASFKAPMIYNPWFEAKGIDAAVVPLGLRAEDFAALFRDLFRITTLHGALITMPHKVTVTGLVDELTTTAKVAGACNAVLKRPDGSLLGDMFDGSGFVRGMQRKGQAVTGARALVVGAGGVGSAIAASLAAAGLAGMSVFDVNAGSADALAGRLRTHYPALAVQTGSRDPAGHAIIVNATPMGMNEGDALPVDIGRVAPGAFVGEVVMKEEYTPLLRAARAKGCPVQVGTDMLFEMIPAYLESFGFGTSTADELRATARLQY